MAERKAVSLSLLAWVVLLSELEMEVLGNVADKMQERKDAIGLLGRQMMDQQLYEEEVMRSTGSSGIKQARGIHHGTRPYHSDTHVRGRGINAIHDHSNHERTVGQGELVVVINGVEFRTRHNDWPTNVPNPTSKGFNADAKVDYPDVPDSVTAYGTDVTGQVNEMQEYFRAWATQNKTHRDYTNHFKAYLAFMDAGWTHAGTLEEDEPFESDRHHIEATSWWDLTEKVRFTGYAGSKDNFENYSFLPMKIVKVNEDGSPVLAQWNYRIAIMEVGDLPLSHLNLVDDLSVRARYGWTIEQLAETRRARFYLSNETRDHACTWCYIDDLMALIPGKDNCPGDLTDTAFGTEALSYKDETTLNTAYYHRLYKTRENGELKTHRRSNWDPNVWFAQTTDEKVAATTLNHNGVNYEQRWTYAIPLEIVYLTPLYKWNPYGIQQMTGGAGTADNPYVGYANPTYYLTPEIFYSATNVTDKDDADTSEGVVHMLGGDGKTYRTQASGVHIFLPEIPGVGTLRTRWPISYLHDEGSGLLMEVDALGDAATRMRTYRDIFIEKPTVVS